MTPPLVVRVISGTLSAYGRKGGAALSLLMNKLLTCRSCRHPILRMRPDSPHVETCGQDGLHIDGEGVGAPGGVYHLDCLEFCHNCEEVEDSRYLATNEHICRLCREVAQDALQAVERAVTQAIPLPRPLARPRATQ